MMNMGFLNRLEEEKLVMAPILYYSPKNWNSSTETKIELAKTWGIYLTKKPWCLIGGLDLFFIFPFSWEFHNPN